MTLAIVTTYYNEVETIGNVMDALSTTPRPFMVFLIDDCSTKPPTEVLQKYGHEDWFHYIRNETNVGPIVGLNRAIKSALEMGADYIAINDSDDISYESRFPQQLAAFKNDPDLMMIGGAADFVDHETGEYLWLMRHPSHNDAIHRKQKINSAFVHSTVTYRAEVFEKVGFYKEGTYAYDYEMITRILRAGCKAANIDETVLKYNVRVNSMSVSKRRTQVASRLNTQLRHVDFFDFWTLFGIFRSLIAYIAPNMAATSFKIMCHKLTNKPS